MCSSHDQEEHHTESQTKNEYGPSVIVHIESESGSSECSNHF